MKFSSVFFFSSLAFAAPQLVSRQQTVIGTITDAVNTLEDATSKNFDQIKNLVDSVEDNVSAQVEDNVSAQVEDNVSAQVEDNVSAQVEASLRANYEAILSAFEDATESIVDVTTNAGGGIVDSVRRLSRAQLDELAEAIRASQRIVRGLEATIRVTVTDLTPDLKDAIQGEIDAVEDAVAPFVGPLSAFAEAASRASANAGVTIRGLRNALKEIDGVLRSVAKSLGIPGLGNVINLGGLLGGL